jgi:transcriptional regulator with XRE-family HTH domain
MLGRELRDQRLSHGLSQATVARAARTSRSQVSRIELGLAPNVDLRELCVLCSVLGLDLSVKVYPASSPIRDTAHRALIERFRLCVHPSATWRFEVPLPGAGEQRSWDCQIRLRLQTVAIEAETRPGDVQALQRRLALKRRDDPSVDQAILLLADTRHNRRLLHEHGEALRTEFPGQPREVLAALKGGEPLREGGILLL